VASDLIIFKIHFQLPTNHLKSEVLKNPETSYTVTEHQIMDNIENNLGVQCKKE
jgi:hypothetical protein